MRLVKPEPFFVYFFNELSEKNQEKVLENFYDINVSHDWWDFIHEDAADIGLKIHEFDTGRRSFIDAEFTVDGVDVAENIIKAHGESCETYQDAIRYRFIYENISVNRAQVNADIFCVPGKWLKYFDSYDGLWDDGTEDIQEEAENDFLYDLKETYLKMLRNEYLYLTSKEGIVETISTNEYEFTENGKIY